MNFLADTWLLGKQTITVIFFWYVDGVEKYHRTFSEIINSVINAGFSIEKVKEPLPSEFAISRRNGLAKEFIKPSFIIIKALKKVINC